MDGDDEADGADDPTEGSLLISVSGDKGTPSAGSAAWRKIKIKHIITTIMMIKKNNDNNNKGRKLGLEKE